MKRALEDDIKECYEALATDLNNGYKKREWFICHECNELELDDTPVYLETSKWGHERGFCSTCTIHCDKCDARYCNAMAYQHEECASSSDDDDSSSSDSSSSSSSDEESSSEISDIPGR